jgi:hypothetical protein
MPFKKKNFISILLGLSFLVLSLTGVLMYLLAHAELTTTLHLVFGFALVGVALFHIINNWASLKSYSVARRTEDNRYKWASKEFILAFCISAIFGIGIYFQLPPFEFIYTWGEKFRSSQKASLGEEFNYTVYSVGKENQGTKLSIDLRKGPYWRWPTYAIWLEDSAGNYIQTLYVTHKLGRNDFDVKVIKNEKGEDVFIKEPETKSERERPEALPVWSHLFGKKSEKGNFVPSGGNILPDAYTGATLTDNFLLHAKSEKTLPDKVKVKFEINHSFDWNEYYSEDRFPDDPVYSGSGRVGQPSLVYETLIDLESPEKYYVLKVIGRGHHSGQSGELYSDLSNMTTALELVDRVIVEVKKN